MLFFSPILPEITLWGGVQKRFLAYNISIKEYNFHIWKGDVVMKIKNFAIGALAAAMLFTGTSVMEAAVYNTSASRLPTNIDSRCGRTEAFLLKNTRFDVKHTMTVNYAEEYVAPCFSRKGIYISDMEAKAIAFAALQMYDVQQNSNGATVSFSAKGEADSGDGDYWLTTIYDNKKYINAFISTYDELRTENAHSIPARKGYAQTGTACLPKVYNTPIKEYTTSTANLKTWTAIGLPA